MSRILLFCVALFTLAGCSQEQVERAEKAVITAQELLHRAQEAEAIAAKAVESARAMADILGNTQASLAVEKAESALGTVRAAVETARGTVSVAETAAKAAQAAQEAGGSTVDVLLAVVSTAVPAAGALLLTVRKLLAARTAFRQTVDGLDNVRATMAPDDWKRIVKPALEGAQDEATKAAVAKAQL